MDVLARRAYLAITDNPDVKFDYVVSLAGSFVLAADHARCHVEVRYVPDRFILLPDTFAKYMAAFATLDWHLLEAAAAAILNDFANELVARWIQVTISRSMVEQDGQNLHQVMLEDRQPKWDNPALLGRLKAH